MLIYRILSRLLDYPDQALRAHLPEIASRIEADTGLDEAERKIMLDFLAWMQAGEPYVLEGHYVQTFDLTPEYSLHLTHHLFGDDDRERGPAMVDIAEHYKSYELEVVEGELPDYLPLLLEYASTLDETEARFFLADAAKVLDVLAANLEKAGSPYAPLVRLIEQRGRLVSQAA
ncbi:nitrate reductase molybdenum cofactor assembly chaperone [Thermithiobacillus plumbiphilus]|uniref:Nitrate reductase molybdenum cofactor assembly chaperone n=1 Tax=Thermithiobacillus plumbiphilus TaxID=1729899 RepID=A0ABU9D823_9PROT